MSHPVSVGNIGAGSACDPPNPKTTGLAVWKVSLHGLGAAGPLMLHPILSVHTVNFTVTSQCYMRLALAPTFWRAFLWRVSRR
jgi:hypothetical protein